jgi:hypothetical protein
MISNISFYYTFDSTPSFNRMKYKSYQMKCKSYQTIVSNDLDHMKSNEIRSNDLKSDQIVAFIRFHSFFFN